MVMKTRLNRVSAVELGFFLGFVGFLLAIPSAVSAFLAFGRGGTVALTGFFSSIFTDSMQSRWILIAYPVLNGVGGFIGGLVIGLIYNFYARRFGGISIEIAQPDEAAERAAGDYPSQSCVRCGYTILRGILRCPNCGGERA